MMRLWFRSLGLLIITIGACTNPPDFPIEPEIEFAGLSTNELRQSAFNEDSVFVFIDFTDGDGDLGSEDSLNIFVTDLRDNNPFAKFRIPYIDPAGANNGISGQIMLKMFSTCCIYPNGQPPCTPSTEFPTDTVQYEFYIVDRKGHESNRIQSPPILLHCE